MSDYSTVFSHDDRSGGGGDDGALTAVVKGGRRGMKVNFDGTAANSGAAGGNGAEDIHGNNTVSTPFSVFYLLLLPLCCKPLRRQCC